MLDMKIGKIAAEEQDQDKNYGPVDLTNGGSNMYSINNDINREVNSTAVHWFVY